MQYCLFLQYDYAIILLIGTMYILVVLISTEKEHRFSTVAVFESCHVL